MFDCQLYLCGHGETRDNTVLCLLNLAKSLPYKIDVQYVSGDALIGRSRSIAASRFLKDNQAPYMVFIDTDIIFTPFELDLLIKALYAGYDIIAGAYSVASGERLAVRSWDHTLKIDGEIYPVEYVSTGFMGLSKRALEAIRDKCAFAWYDYTKDTTYKQIGLPLLHKGEWCECYPFFESGAYMPEMFYLSEDWDICNKGRRVGYKTYCHTGCLVDHVKTVPIVCEEVLKRTTKENELTNNPDIDLVRDLSEFLNKPVEQVRNDVLNCKAYEQKGRTDDEWLYDLVQLNSYDVYKNTRLYPISALQNHRILDYGCGIGTASIYVSEKNKVTGFDIAKKSIEFANYRIKKHGIANVDFTDKEPEDLTQFDIILFIDILEHFEDLKTFMVEFGKKVKKGTRIYHVNAFEAHIPEHFDHSKEWAQILDEAGFIKIDDRWSVKGC